MIIQDLNLELLKKESNMDLEMLCFEIISNVGSAKSKYIEAMKFAKNGQIAEAKAKIKEGEDFYYKGHLAHSKFVELDANDELPNTRLILAHAEDQLMSSETVKIMANEFIYLYENFDLKRK